MLTFLRALLILALACYAPANAQMTMVGVGEGGFGAAASCTFSTISFTGGSLGSASLSRASSATYINSSGVLTTATTNAARFNFDANYPVGNAAPSLTGPFLLVEPAATNLILQSNLFSAGNWFTFDGGVVTPGVFTSPDGTADGWSFSNGTGFAGLGEIITVSNIPYVLSVWGKNITGTVPLQTSLGAVTNNLTLTSTITRFASNPTPPAGSTAAQFAINSGTTTLVAGIFGAQLETGTVATSYLPTGTGTASRSADVVTFTQPSGCGHNVYTFDDNSTQTVSQAPGTATVPTNLNRPNLKSIAGTA